MIKGNLLGIYCSNTSEKTLGKIIYFQFPNQKIERKLAKIWLNKIGTGYSINTFKFSKDGIASGEN